MTVVVPNLSSTNAQLVQLQITYASNFYQPPAISISPSAVLVGPPVTNLVETVPSGGEAWYTTVYTWRITPSPNQETISVVGGSTYGSIIDQIILDTQVTNPPPVATTLTVNRTTSLSLKVFWPDVTNQWSSPNGYPVTLAGFNLTSTNSVTVSTNGQLILYPKAAANLNDQISYTISDGRSEEHTSELQ